MRHVDDATATGVAHEGNGRASAPNGGKELEIEILLPGVVVDFLERSQGFPAGVIDEDIQAPESRHHFGDEALGFARDRDVHGKGEDFRGVCCLADRGCRLLKRVCAAAADRHASTLRRKRERGREANAFTAARNRGDLTS